MSADTLESVNALRRKSGIRDLSRAEFSERVRERTLRRAREMADRHDRAERQRRAAMENPALHHSTFHTPSVFSPAHSTHDCSPIFDTAACAIIDTTSF